MEHSKSPVNQSVHQKQILWQVWIPLSLGILMILALAVLAVMTDIGNGVEGGRLAGVSLIFLIIPSLIVCFFVILLLSLLIFGVYKLTEILPVYSFKALMYVIIASDFIRLWSDRVAQPVLVIHEGLAGLYQILDKFSPKSNK
jgi:hypothetical protein